MDKKSLRRNLIAIDETIVRGNRKKFYIFSGVDVERNELILMRVYTTSLIDKASWLKRGLFSVQLLQKIQSGIEIYSVNFYILL